MNPNDAFGDPAQVHRSVLVSRITTLGTQATSSTAAHNNGRQLALAQLWSHCASSVSFTSSVTTGTIVELVAKGALNWHEALQGFENALTSAHGQALANIVHALSALVMAAAGSPSLASRNKSASKNIFGARNSRHPFVTLITTKVGVETVLLAEMDKILDQEESSEYKIRAFDILSPFLDFCLLDRHQRCLQISTATVMWINRTLNESLHFKELEPFATHLFNYLCTVPSRFPLDRAQPSATLQATIRALVDMVRLPTTQQSLAPQFTAVLGSRLLLILLSWMADMRRYGLATLPLMQTVQTLLRPRRGYTAPILPFRTLFPLLSFLLLNAPTVDEQQALVEWIFLALSTATDPIEPMISNLAFLPIFQVMGESQSEAVSKKCAEILQRLEAIPKNADPAYSETEDSLLIPSTGVAAMISAEVEHLQHSWIGGRDQDMVQHGESPSSLGDDRVMASLICTTFMFHPEEERRMRAISEQALVEEGRLVTLVLFIYLLRVDSSPLVKLHLLQEAIPSLVTFKDEVVTAKVLRTILTLINGVSGAPTGTKIKGSHMGAVGIRILFLIWKRQPRVWKTLRHVIHEWVESRPRLHKAPIKGEPEYDMEVAVLATIRDICAYDAAGYAEVLIPFMATLLQTVELYASSICTIVETMNLTVEANVVEPRAAWNVLLCHIAEYAMKTRHPGMLQFMCEFYGIVGARNEDTQVYLDLREALLQSYIQPLLTSDDPRVLASALRALSCYSASEIMETLGVESPTLYVREKILEAQDTLVVDEYSMILDKLVRHELLHMRRSLFKDAATKKAVPDSLAGNLELDRMQGVLLVVSNSILKKWQSGDVNPGLRIGYALSSQLCSSAVEKLPVSNFGQEDDLGDDSIKAIRARQSYRNVLSALTDVTLTDHVVERITAMEGWTALFDNMWIPNDDAQTLVIAETLVGDLYKKMNEGYVPAHCANALLAITGLILSLHRHSHPASTVQSAQLAKQLMQYFVRPETFSDVAGSDEVQFAVLVSLSFITPLAAVDEKLVRSVLEVFTDRVSQDADVQSVSIELTSWSSFSAGWAFCNLLGGLFDSPTKTAELNEICGQTLQQLVGVLESDKNSFALMMGISMSFSRLSGAVASLSTQRNKDGLVGQEASAILKVKAMARADLEFYLNDPLQVFSPQGLARLLGAPWVISFADRTEATPNDRKSDMELLDRALLSATSRRDLQPQLVHFTVPFCNMIHTNLDTRNPSSSEISLLTARIHSLVNIIKTTPTSAARHTAVIALGSCFGIDWSRGPMVTSMGSHGLFSFLSSTSTMTSVSNSAMSTLIDLSGLHIAIQGAAGSTVLDSTATSAHAVALPGIKPTTSKSLMMSQDLKAGRLAAMVLGHIACQMHRLGQIDTGKVIGTSSEPKDYSRLPVSSSWLRALWDVLWEPLQMGTAQRAQKSFKSSLELLLYTVHSLPTPLPAVNWFPLLTQLVASDPELLVPAIHMASRHANTSTSLMEFLIMALSNFKTTEGGAGSRKKVSMSDGVSVSAKELSVGEEGIGRILTLGGLSLPGNDQALAELDKVRGLDGLAKKVTLPSSRVVDLVEKLIQALFSYEQAADAEMEVLQLVFLDTLSNHTRPYRQGRGSSAGSKEKTALLSEDAKELLNDLRACTLRAFYRFKISGVASAHRVLRRLADLSLTSVSHLETLPLESGGGDRLLKEAIGISSLYRAGYLSAQQEGKLTLVAQSALSMVCSERATSQWDMDLAESALACLLYAMQVGVGDSLSGSTAQQAKKRNGLRLVWLQRILDLLVLLSGMPVMFARGVRMLLGGAVLLWWDERDAFSLGGMALQQQGSLDNNGALTSRDQDDAEADLLAMAEDDMDGQTHVALDYNILRDDSFELWYGRWSESIAHGSGSTDLNKEEQIQQQRHQAILGRLSVVLPDIIVGSAVASAAAASSSASGLLLSRSTAATQKSTTKAAVALESQLANRILRLAQDTNVSGQEKQFLVSVLRKVEELIPAESSWVLL